MMCETCDHAHVSTEQAIAYYRYGRITKSTIEETLMVCSEPGCPCSELSPTDAEDRIALIKAGELDG